MTHTFESVLQYTEPLSILYVEDDPYVRESMSEILSLLCNHIETAENGKEGLETYLAYHQKNGIFFDIVISDILMPLCDGIAMSKEILEHNPDQEIIIISAQGESTGFIEMINMGISHFLPKPIQDTHLFNALYQVGKRLAVLREKASMEAEIRNLNRQLEEKITALEKLAREDALTGIANRRYFYEKADLFLEQSKKEGTSLYIVVMDIDIFKQINDTYGHVVGDKVILFTAQTLLGIIDENSFLGRVGGDEFMMLFRNKPLDSVLEKMRQIQQSINKEHTFKGVSLHFTVSMGIAQLRQEDLTIDDLIIRADQNLYKAKANGRNDIVYR
jgi:diguanylate cyclase (GGDEF)-like protein